MEIITINKNDPEALKAIGDECPEAIYALGNEPSVIYVSNVVLM